MEQTAGQTREEQRKISGQAKKKAGRLPKKAAKAARKGAAAAAPAAETAVEDVAESVADSGGTVTGGGPTKSIKPAGRMEEMSLRQLRSDERGRGVAGILGTGGARGDVKRRMRQGTIHTEEGQEALQGFQESREAREKAQQAKREARAVLRGGEYTPRTPTGFRNLREGVASRAIGLGEVLSGDEVKPAPASTPQDRGAPAPAVAPERNTTEAGTRSVDEILAEAERESLRTDPQSPSGGRTELEEFWDVPAGTPMGPDSETAPDSEGFSEDPVVEQEPGFSERDEDPLSAENDPSSSMYSGIDAADPGYGDVESSLAAFNEPAGLVGSFLAGGRGHRGTRARAGQMQAAIMKANPDTPDAKEMAQDLSALMADARVPEGMSPEDYMQAVIDTYRDVSPNFRHNFKYNPGKLWSAPPDVISPAKQMFAAELNARIDAGSSPL